MMRRHAELLAQHMGEERGCMEFRKHVSWYLKGFAAGGELRRSLAMVSSLAELDELLARLDRSEPFPVSELGAPRGPPGLAARPGRPAGGLARGHRRHRLRAHRGRYRDHRRLRSRLHERHLTRGSTLSGVGRGDLGHATRIGDWPPSADVVES